MSQTPADITPDAVCALLIARAESLERQADQARKAMVTNGQAEMATARAHELRRAVDEIRHRFGYR